MLWKTAMPEGNVACAASWESRSDGDETDDERRAILAGGEILLDPVRETVRYRSLYAK